ncbi:hypothetical protein PO124_03160 [Bacillus licheniformis]|nr:hypothetical protein [Bacillus licheniformis]
MFIGLISLTAMIGELEVIYSFISFGALIGFILSICLSSAITTFGGRKRLLKRFVIWLCPFRGLFLRLAAA